MSGWPGGQPVPAHGAAQQPGQLGHAGVVGVAGLAAVIEYLVPVGVGQLADRGAGAVVEVEPDRVVHPPPGCGVQRGDVADQVQGGARAIAGDQQVPPVPGRELRDRLVEYLDVIDRGVAAGVARAQPKRQRLAGVVTPRGQRVMTPGALECARGLLFVAVRDLDRGVHADHDRLPQVAVGHPRGRDPPVPGRDQPPHVPAGPRPRGRDPFPLVRADLLQRPPQRRSPRPPTRTARPDRAAPPGRTSPGRRRRSTPRCRPAPGRGRAPG